MRDPTAHCRIAPNWSIARVAPLGHTGRPAVFRLRHRMVVECGRGPPGDCVLPTNQPSSGVPGRRNWMDGRSGRTQRASARPANQNRVDPAGQLATMGRGGRTLAHSGTIPAIIPAGRAGRTWRTADPASPRAGTCLCNLFPRQGVANLPGQGRPEAGRPLQPRAGGGRGEGVGGH